MNGTPVIGLIARRDKSEQWSGYALYGQGQAYARSVVLAGGAPVIIPLEMGQRAWRSIYDRVDGLLFPGGVDVAPWRYGQEPHPRLGQVDEALDEAEFALARWALEDRMPVLAVCRGIQVINVVAGGSLYQDIPAQVPDGLCHACNAPEYPRSHRAHLVHVEQNTQLAAALGTLACWTNSRHHQAVKDVAPGFVVTARAPDGVVEGIEHRDAPFVVGVQWHPENLAAGDPQQLGLFRGLIEASRQRMIES